MDDHYHLVVETPEPNVSPGMQQLNGSYALRFNHRHERVGHLFQGRFHTVLVDRESHLLEVCRYVALNPVRAGRCTRPEAWAWSSYRATAGFAPRPPFLTTSAVHALLARDAERACVRYRAFVAEGH